MCGLLASRGTFMNLPNGLSKIFLLTHSSDFELLNDDEIRIQKKILSHNEQMVAADIIIGNVPV